MGQSNSLPIIVVLVATLVATITDVWKFRIHNVITIPLLLSGLVYNGVVGGAVGVLESVLAILFGFGILIGFYLLGGIGSGDVKLLAAVGAWLGMLPTVYVFVASALATGVYAFVLIVINGRLRETGTNLLIAWHRVAAVGRYLAAEENVEDAVQTPDCRRRLVPFAAMVALGVSLLALAVWLRNLSDS